MKKYFNILSSLMLLLLCGSCADEFEWNGTSVGSDEYLIAYTVADSKLETVTATRASEADRDKIGDLTLVIFDKTQGTLLKNPIFFTPGTPDCTSPSGENAGTIVVKKSSVANGEWYLIANAKSEIDELVKTNSNITKDEFLSTIKSGTGDYEFPDQLNADNKHVMINHHNITLGQEDATQTNAYIFDLQRIYARVSVQITKQGLPFRMTEMRLSRIVPSGDLGMAPSTVLNNTNPLTEAADNGSEWRAPAIGTQHPGTPAFKYAGLNEQIVAATYPYKKPAKADEKSDNSNKILMIVKGFFNKGTSTSPMYDKECYYAIELPDMEANKHYQVQINGVQAEGKEHAYLAELEPGGLSVTFVDETEDVHSIITDGENVLAVLDTVRLSASGKDLTRKFILKARIEGDNTPTLTITKKNDAPDDSWLVKGGDGNPFVLNKTVSLTQSDDESKNSLFSTEFDYQVTASENKGSERYTVYTVQLAGTKLERDIVILQEANADVKYSDVVDISLTITRDGQSPVEIPDYLGFINPKVVATPATANLLGVQPEENGGRIRNIGLHLPMPNGGVTYTYTITLKNGATAQLPATPIATSNSGGVIKYTFKDTDAPLGETGETARYSYVIKSDAIIIKSGGVEYTLDLYHTGFFHEDGGKWYYYEVMRQDNKNLWWLDRNIGATSAGMSVLDANNNALAGSWPLAGDKSGGEYYKMDAAGANAKRIAACPAGWDVPSYAQLRSLTTSANFNITRRTNNNNRAYFAPAYSFEIKEDGATRRITSYFPQVKYKDNGTLSGDAAAGYYLTTTGTGNANWYQVMQFIGLNASSQNLNFSSRKASLRCCAGTFNPSTEATNYECAVQGYTHVFLYYLNSDGSKTYLTTWPGEQIAVYEDLNRYHPFSLTTTVDYDSSRLYVIFNKVTRGGARELSNVSEDDVKERNGIPFVNGGRYDYFAGTNAEGAINGNWIEVETPVEPVFKTVTYALRLPVCDTELTRTNAMRIVLVGTSDVGTIEAWTGKEMTLTSDGNYYYYKGSMTIDETTTPADHFDKYLFVYGDDNHKTTNDDISWSAGKHTGEITDAAAKAACGNPDYLYTVWAVSGSEPDPQGVGSSDSPYRIYWKKGLTYGGNELKQVHFWDPSNLSSPGTGDYDGEDGGDWYYFEVQPSNSGNFSFNFILRDSDSWNCQTGTYSINSKSQFNTDHECWITVSNPNNDNKNLVISTSTSKPSSVKRRSNSISGKMTPAKRAAEARR